MPLSAREERRPVPTIHGTVDLSIKDSRDRDCAMTGEQKKPASDAQEGLVPSNEKGSSKPRLEPRQLRDSVERLSTPCYAVLPVRRRIATDATQPTTKDSKPNALKAMQRSARSAPSSACRSEVPTPRRMSCPGSGSVSTNSGETAATATEVVEAIPGRDSGERPPLRPLSQQPSSRSIYSSSPSVSRRSSAWSELQLDLGVLPPRRFIDKSAEAAMTARLSRPRKRTEPEPVKPRKLVHIRNTTTGRIEEVVVDLAPMRRVDQVQHQVSMYQRSLEAEERRNRRLAAKYLQPLTPPPKPLRTIDDVYDHLDACEKLHRGFSSQALTIRG